MGGLGNQLQQYALYRKMVRMGKEARLDISWFTQQDNKNKELTHRELELDRLDRLVYEVCTLEEKAQLIGSEGIAGRLRRKLLPGGVKWFRESEMYHPEIFEFEDMYISGSAGKDSISPIGKSLAAGDGKRNKKLLFGEHPYPQRGLFR